MCGVSTAEAPYAGDDAAEDWGWDEYDDDDDEDYCSPPVAKRSRVAPKAPAKFLAPGARRADVKDCRMTIVMGRKWYDMILEGEKDVLHARVLRIPVTDYLLTGRRPGERGVLAEAPPEGPPAAVHPHPSSPVREPTYF